MARSVAFVGARVGVFKAFLQARYARAMGLLFDSFWRAAAYCLRPRVMLLSAAPLVLMAILALVSHHFYWDSAVAAMTRLLDGSSLLSSVLTWLEAWGVSSVLDWLAPLMLVLLVSPVLVVLSLLGVALLMTPALVNMVAARRFPQLMRKQGGTFISGLLWSIASTLMALVALVVSMPLWLVPPLVLVLPPLIWGWLSYRVMAFDALAEHATQEERMELFKRYRPSLLGIGILTGYLGAAPSIVWASGVVFAAAFVVLLPLAIWIYTLVFAFSSLWFAHFCLHALERLRAERELRAQPVEGNSLARDVSASDPPHAPDANNLTEQHRAAP